MNAEYMQDAAWLLREKYGGIKSEAFYADETRLSNGEPLAYLIGHIPFLSSTIYLDSHPLIPRTETEYWTQQMVNEIGSRTVRVLDLCAGSGCIGVAILKECPNSKVDFVEIDTRHHTTIEKNLKMNGIESVRANVYGGNLFEYVTDIYDYILTNPPYIDPEKKARTESSVLTHEPHSALFGGNKGMEYITRILREAPQFLRPGGILALEHEPEQTKTMHALATQHNYATVQTSVDQYKNERVTKFTTRDT